MASNKNKTLMLQREDVPTAWFVLDASGKTLGRFASEIAKILRGKHKPTFTPNTDVGDGVIVINADKIKVTGTKSSRKIYRHYTGYMSGLREIPYSTMLERKPEAIVERAVYGMMPRTRIGRAQRKRLRVVVGTEHNMDAQKPIQV